MPTYTLPCLTDSERESRGFSLSAPPPPSCPSLLSSLSSSVFLSCTPPRTTELLSVIGRDTPPSSTSPADVEDGDGGGDEDGDDDSDNDGDENGNDDNGGDGGGAVNKDDDSEGDSSHDDSDGGGDADLFHNGGNLCFSDTDAER